MNYLRLWASVVLLIAIGVGGCGLLSLDEQSGNLKELIDRNRSEWEESDVQNYNFEYNKTVGEVEYTGINVHVRQGHIDSTFVVDGTRAPDRFLTVDDLYDEIVRNFEREDRGNLQVSFNEEFSYPSRYRMLPGTSTEGRGVVVTTFDLIE